jgi:hypothetical protein
LVKGKCNTPTHHLGTPLKDPYPNLGARFPLRREGCNTLGVTPGPWLHTYTYDLLSHVFKWRRSTKTLETIGYQGRFMIEALPKNVNYHLEQQRLKP